MLDIDKKKVLLRAKVKDGNIDSFHGLIQEKHVAKDFDIEIKENQVILKDGFTIKSINLASHLKGCKKATLFAATIGDNFNNTTELKSAFGTEAIEALGDKICKDIEKKAKSITHRFSVGFGDWDLNDQKKILDLLKTDFIQLSNNNMMSPKKTITAIVGWKNL